ncbi:MAG: amino-acid N-acetyltransferase [Treponema sp.]|jgi:amino-acid N-acetyltransferase|nr:amino-acid N-acetyltransferase [Treponema sp.]
MAVLTQVELIREAFHYQSRFDGSTMVFKIDCPVTEAPRFPSLMRDLALLSKIGFRIVIVAGAKERIDAVLREYDVASSYHGPVRITPSVALPFVEMAAFHVATRFMTLSASRVDAVIGNFVRARGLGVVDGVDMGHTGFVEKVLVDSLERTLRQGMVPILPCIGWSPAGKIYNVASDEIALAVSAALGAVKLFIVSVDGGLKAGTYVLPPHVKRSEVDETGQVIRLTPQETEFILVANRDRGDDKPLQDLSLALKVSKAGVERVHMIDGEEEGVILQELFSNMGSGTMVYTDEYESIRKLKSSDVPDILRLMEPLMQMGVLIRRTPEQIQEKKDDYVVIEIDGSVRACAALHDWGERQAEIAALATDPSFTTLGLGRRIVRFLLEKAKQNGFRRVFVLTTHTHDWFEALGFTSASVESLPSRRGQLYDQNRKSKVFAVEFKW